jgi:hypothetical protein
MTRVILILNGDGSTLFGKRYVWNFIVRWSLIIGMTDKIENDDAKTHDQQSENIQFLSLTVQRGILVDAIATNETNNCFIDSM